MPSGYTAPIYEGTDIDFKTFMLRCARGFGAAIMLRDSPAEVLPTPDNVLENAEYYEKKIVELTDELVLFSTMPPDDAEYCAQKAYEEERAYWEEMVIKNEEMRQRYAAMIEQVEQWTPPATHVEFKEWVLGQLKDSLDFDCKYVPNAPVLLNGPEWLEKKIDRVQRDIAYNEEQNARCVKRNEERATWIRDLIESLEEKVSV